MWMVTEPGLGKETHYLGTQNSFWVLPFIRLIDFLGGIDHMKEWSHWLPQHLNETPKHLLFRV
jgi:hypothetical protein